MNSELTTGQFMALLESMHSEIKAVHECFSVLDCKIDRVAEDLKEQIVLVDTKVTGLSRRLDSVEERLSNDISALRSEIIDHRNNTELHHIPKKRILKKVA